MSDLNEKLEEVKIIEPVEITEEEVKDTEKLEEVKVLEEEPQAEQGEVGEKLEEVEEKLEEVGAEPEVKSPETTEPIKELEEEPQAEQGEIKEKPEELEVEPVDYKELYNSLAFKEADNRVEQDEAIFTSQLHKILDDQITKIAKLNDIDRDSKFEDLSPEKQNIVANLDRDIKLIREAEISKFHKNKALEQSAFILDSMNTPPEKVLAIRDRLVGIINSEDGRWSTDKLKYVIDTELFRHEILSERKASESAKVEVETVTQAIETPKAKEVMADIKEELKQTPTPPIKNVLPELTSEDVRRMSPEEFIRNEKLIKIQLQKQIEGHNG